MASLIVIPSTHGRGRQKVHGPHVLHELLGVLVPLHDVIHALSAPDDGIRTADDAHETMPHDGVIVDEDLGVCLTPEPFDILASRADEQTRHLAREAQAEDVLAWLLAQQLRTTCRRPCLLVISELNDPRQHSLKCLDDVGGLIGVDPEHAVLRPREIVAFVAEDELCSGLLLDFILSATACAQQEAGQALGAQDLEGKRSPWHTRVAEETTPAPLVTKTLATAAPRLLPPVVARGTPLHGLRSPSSAAAVAPPGRLPPSRRAGGGDCQADP
mmetsp:Transcript_51068/g.129779  ORF Transcript_51068/g.129779 Transcript_51068/m.129779 type:complete len:272 (+) Transcript_51068:767-1582(+)